VDIFNGDCLDVLKQLTDNSVDSVVTDPPYGLNFMNKHWDYDVPSVDIWREVLRVLKPGGHLLSFGGTRTYHRMVVNIEDAGFEIRDQIQYLYGSGFPKSLNIEKQLQSKYGGKENTKHNLRPLRETDLPQEVYDEETEGKVLQSGVSQQGLQRSMQGEESKEIITHGEESCLERRSDHVQEEGELQECSLCQMSNRVYGDGTEGRLCDGTQVSNGNVSGENTIENRGGSSHRSQPHKQRHYELDALCEQHRTQEIRRWQGWGTALKPANEPICLARKPISENTIAENVLKWGTGGINIDGCRVELSNGDDPRLGGKGDWSTKNAGWVVSGSKRERVSSSELGRFPANVITSYPENEYLCKNNLSKDQKDKLYKWLNENT